MATNVYSDEIEAQFEKYPIINKVSEFVPELCLAFVNAFVPTITKVITRLELWDFQSTLLMNQIWRNYLAKIFNVALYALINAELVAQIQFKMFTDDALLPFDSGRYPCPED